MSTLSTSKSEMDVRRPSKLLFPDNRMSRSLDELVEQESPSLDEFFTPRSTFKKEKPTKLMIPSIVVDEAVETDIARQFSTSTIVEPSQLAPNNSANSRSSKNLYYQDDVKELLRSAKKKLRKMSNQTFPTKRNDWKRKTTKKKTLAW